MRRAATVLAAVLVLALALPVMAQTKIAVTEIKARRGVDPVLAKVIEEHLAFELAKTGAFQVTGRDDILRMLDHEQQKQMTGCADDSCLAEIGGALGVDKLVGGAMDKVGESVLLTLKLINVRTGQVERRESERLKGATEEQALDGIAILFRRMFAPELGETGKEKGGGRLWTWVATGAAGAVLVAGAVVLGIGQGDLGEANDLAGRSMTEDVYLSRVESLEDEGTAKTTAGGVLLGVGGALAVTAVVLFFLEGQDDSKPVAVAPVVSGQGGAIVVGGRF